MRRRPRICVSFVPVADDKSNSDVAAVCSGICGTDRHMSPKMCFIEQAVSKLFTLPNFM